MKAIIEMIIHSIFEPLRSFVKILMMAENDVTTDQKHSAIRRSTSPGSMCSNVATYGLQIGAGRDFNH